MDVVATYLNTLVQTKEPVAVFLRSGTKLTGIITNHDEYALILSDSHDALIPVDWVSCIKPLAGLPERGNR